MSSNENPLDPFRVLEILRKTLPRSQPLREGNDGATASGSVTLTPDVLFKSQADAVSGVIQACMLALDFRLVGLGEEGPVDESVMGGSDTVRPLPAEWNASQDAYAFRYKHDRSAFTFLIKVLKMASKVMINGLAPEDNKLRTLTITLPDMMSPFGKYPFTTADEARVLAAPNPPSSPYFGLFKSYDKIHDLISGFKVDVIVRIAPNLQKEGYQETVSQPTPTSSSSSSRPSRSQPVPRPAPAEPSRPSPFSPLGGIGGPMGPGRSPFAIGDRDLDPFAAAPGVVGIGPRFGGGIGTLGGGFGGGGGMGDPFGGGGMYVGPSHPMFGPRGGGGGGFGGGGWGGGLPAGPGGERLPPGAVPPGARFDPIMPGLPGPGFGPRPGTMGRGTGGGGIPPGGIPGSSGIEPTPPGWGPGRRLGGDEAERLRSGEPDADIDLPPQGDMDIPPHQPPSERPPPGYEDMFM
ncbi:hypothetical protein M427DRAFT_142867 [Gonapodya prolifera JEL478]|uniref:PI31 proteasome regulator N-terminal domain-containing protein n=1 Tax=Gonapodya prolifera (strain JEL478) TaxID=1344416 RepID=A0A139ATD5_GONPJ|nr:hypothetical protein M427DRAFT_142867 [Gonapodya prolifera JEL478]|eukprot:KXS19988.1 hypothetical protein M427DRAFT_142867 [Gonapodya prolifera JEL478]